MTIFVDNVEVSASISNSFKNKFYLVLFTKSLTSHPYILSMGQCFS